VSNHWWTIKVRHPLQNEIGYIAIALIPGSDTISEIADTFDACGQDCALKIVSEQMGKVTA
jgi:hypothetical protein